MVRVIIVDDSKIARNIVKKIATELGCEVVGEASNGEEGFELYKKTKPNLVFSDIEMPLLDGYGMLQKIIDFDKDAYVVMITSVVNAQFIHNIMQKGAKNSIKKPVNKEKIKKILETVQSKL